MFAHHLHPVNILCFFEILLTKTHVVMASRGWHLNNDQELPHNCVIFGPYDLTI